MNIDFELYRIFYTVANHGNITRASEELKISQPAISKSIKNLEEQLGGQLFIRTKKGVVLTEEGKEFYKYIAKAIEYITSAENKFTDLINLETGCIKIGANTTITKEYLLPYLKKFHQMYPNINIQITTSVTSELLTKLKGGLLDIVIMNLKNRDYGDDLDIMRCKKISDCFVVGQNYEQLSSKNIPLCKLNDYPLILQAKGSNTREFLDSFAKENGIVLNPSMELTSHALVTEFVRIGLGIGYVTKDYIENDLASGKLIELSIKEKIPDRYLGIALSRNHLPNFSTKRLIEIITDQK